MTTLRQQIGQMLIMGFSGTELDESSPVIDWLSKEGLGGVILFDYDLIHQRQGKNLVDQEQIKSLTRQLKHYGTEDGPLFIAIDYEGGAVDRLRHVKGCMKTKTPYELAQLSVTELKNEAGKMADTLKELGFNLNFAPVVDLSLNQNEGIIGALGRSFSADPEQTARIARYFIEVFAEQGIRSCYKHFPGHGSALGDTHLGFVDVTETFHSIELEPYSILLKNKALPVMIMTAHVINRQLEPSGLPATLSKTVLTGLLRQELSFDGVIVSDDLQMQAISHHFSIEEALCLTINAGADMIIFGNQWGEITAPEVIDTIENLVRTKAIALSRIEQAYQRIMQLKQKQFILA